MKNLKIKNLDEKDIENLKQIKTPENQCFQGYIK